MTLPNFIIVGAAKSGTTSLYYYLKQHPDVFMTDPKEPHYFADFDRHVTTLEEYEALFEGHAGRKAVGEASTGYLYYEGSPGWIKKLIPEVKIIMILRNPPEMAHSLWRHMSRGGRRAETRSFTAALKRESRRMADPTFRERHNSWHANYYYFNRALFYGQVKRYLDTFGKDRVLIHLFDDFKEDPARICRETFRFIGVDEDFEPVIRKHNVGWAIRHRGLKKLLEHPKEPLVALGGLLPKGLVSGVKDSLTRLNRKRPPRINEKVRRELLEKYRPDIDKLAELIGRDLSIWYK